VPDVKLTEPSAEALAGRRLRFYFSGRLKRMRRGAIAVGLVVILGYLGGGIPGVAGGDGGPGEVRAAERIVLLRLMPDGRVLEINPATRIAFRDLNRYLDRRLDGRRVRELEIQEPAGGCDQIIVIRYEE
jgi:hypothetical protein